MNSLLKKIDQAITKSDFQTAQAGLNDLIQKSTNDKDRLELVKENGLDLVNKWAQTKHVFIFIRCVVILLNLSNNVKIAEMVGGPKYNSILQTVTELLKNNKDPKLQEFTAGFLRNLAKASLQNKKEIVEKGCFEQMVMILEDFVDDNAIEKEALPTLLNATATIGIVASPYAISTQQETSNVELEKEALKLLEQVMQMGATSVLHDVLKILVSKAVPETVEFISLTLQGLQYIAAYEKGARELFNMKITKLLDELSNKPQFAQNKVILKQSSTLIQLITLNEDLVEDLQSNQDSLSKLLIDLQSTNPDKQYHAIGQVWNLAQTKQNQQVLREREVLDIILGILKTSQYAENLERAAGCVSALCQDPQSAFLCGVKNGVPLLLRLLNVKDEPLLLENSLAALGLMSLLKYNRDIMNQYDVVKRLAPLLSPQQAKTLNTQGKSFAVKLLVSLSIDEKHTMIEHGIVDALIAFVQSNDTPDSLKTDCCSALWNLQNDDEIRMYLHDKNVYEVMTQLLEKTDLSKTSDIVAQSNAGINEADLLKLANQSAMDFDQEKFDMEIENLKRLEEDLNIDSDEEDEEEEEDAQELQPENLDEEGQELQPEELVPEELQPEELKPEELEPEDATIVEELQPEELDETESEELQPELMEEDLQQPESQEHKATPKSDTQLSEAAQKRREEKEKKVREEKEEKKKKFMEEQQKKEKAREELQKKQSKRSRIAKELLQTELSYVDALSKVKTMYMEPLLSTQMGTITTEKFKKIFGDIQLILMINTAFLEELKQFFTDKEDFKTPGTEEQDLGMLFVKRAPTFKLYTSYVNSYDEAEQTLNTQMKTNRKFAEFLESVSSKLMDLGYRQTDLASLLIMPIQRLPRYSLLLGDLLKSSDSEGLASYSILKNAIAQVQKITSYVNETKRDVEFKQKVVELQKKLNLPKEFITQDRLLRKTVRGLFFYVYEKKRPTASRSSKLKCKLYILNDYVIIQRKGIVKKVNLFNLRSSKLSKKIADKDLLGKCMVLEDKESNDNEIELCYELECVDKKQRDELFNEIREYISNLLVAK